MVCAKVPKYLQNASNIGLKMEKCFFWGHKKQPIGWRLVLSYSDGYLYEAVMTMCRYSAVMRTWALG